MFPTSSSTWYRQALKGEQASTRMIVWGEHDAIWKCIKGLVILRVVSVLCGLFLITTQMETTRISWSNISSHDSQRIDANPAERRINKVSQQKVWEERTVNCMEQFIQFLDLASCTGWMILVIYHLFCEWIIRKHSTLWYGWIDHVIAKVDTLPKIHWVRCCSDCPPRTWHTIIELLNGICSTVTRSCQKTALQFCGICRILPPWRNNMHLFFPWRVGSPSFENTIAEDNETDGSFQYLDMVNDNVVETHSLLLQNRTPPTSTVIERGGEQTIEQQQQYQQQHSPSLSTSTSMSSLSWISTMTGTNNTTSKMTTSRKRDKDAWWTLFEVGL